MFYFGFFRNIILVCASLVLSHVASWSLGPGPTPSAPTGMVGLDFSSHQHISINPMSGLSSGKSPRSSARLHEANRMLFIITPTRRYLRCPLLDATLNTRLWTCPPKFPLNQLFLPSRISRPAPPRPDAGSSIKNISALDLGPADCTPSPSSPFPHMRTPFGRRPVRASPRSQPPSTPQPRSTAPSPSPRRSAVLMSSSRTTPPPLQSQVQQQQQTSSRCSAAAARSCASRGASGVQRACRRRTTRHPLLAAAPRAPRRKGSQPSLTRAQGDVHRARADRSVERRERLGRGRAGGRRERRDHSHRAPRNLRAGVRWHAVDLARRMARGQMRKTTKRASSTNKT